MFYSNLLRLVLTPSLRKKRILGIWDFKALPWSVGDPLAFLQTLSVLRIASQAEAIDICIVYDRENPGGNRFSINLSSENVQDYLIDFLPLLGTCPDLGSVYQFNDRLEFYRFLKASSGRYDIFPPLGEHLGEIYNFDGGAPYDHIMAFHAAHGYIPHLRIGSRDRSWADWFYLSHLAEKAVPVTLSLKGTSHSPERNANPEVWLAFIDRCRSDFPEVVFVVVGIREEVFDGLRSRPNVIVAKDFGTSIMEDFALIRTSMLYMAMTSGVCTIAQFSDLPYLMFQMPIYTLHKYGLVSGENFAFATDRQKVFGTDTPVTLQLLLQEFDQLYSTLDRDAWRITALNMASEKHSLPTGRVEVQ